MVTNKNEALRSRRLPIDGQQRPQIILVCHARQPGEQVFQVSQRILAVTLTGHDQGVEDRRTLAGLGVTDKQPVLLSDARGTDGVLDEVMLAATPPVPWPFVFVGPDRPASPLSIQSL